MGETWEQYGQRLMSGDASGLAASTLRGGLRAVEPVYSSLMRVRNRLYASGVFRVHRLPRPTISVGNITAGGTGKTPFVLWLARQLCDEGHKPAILLRGYKSRDGVSDEQRMLESYLNDGPSLRAIVSANPSRLDGAKQAIASNPEIDVFILDDAFQHRRVARDLDIVLINAASPFGYGHVHPRGLLREPLCGLARAHAIVLTHADETSDLPAVESRIRGFARIAPIFHANHVLTGLRSVLPDTADITLDDLRTRRFFAASGIGHPESLRRRLAKFGQSFVGHRWFGDHHAYSREDISDIRRQARDAGADLILVTEKDWAKLQRIDGIADGIPSIHRLEMEIRFAGNDEQRMIDLVRSVLTGSAASTARL